MDEVKNNNAVSKDKPEAVDHPAHYQGKHECIEVMRALFGDRAVADFCRCNSFKYRFRADGKGGAEDIRKAEWYEDYLMKMNVGDPIDADDPTDPMVAASVDAYRKMSDGIDELRSQVSAGLEEFFEKIMKNMGDSDSGEQSGRESEMKHAAAEIWKKNESPKVLERCQVVAAECSTVRITWTSDKEVKPYGYSISGISAYTRHGEEMTLENCRRLAELRGWRSGNITVIVEYPLAGKVYSYGNHGHFWEEVGTICGYA